jgi:hypothetical protein
MIAQPGKVMLRIATIGVAIANCCQGQSTGSRREKSQARLQCAKGQ